jgi:hypothetical protein
MRLVTTILTIWLALTSSVAARDIFVNNVAGDDQRSGDSPTPHGGEIGPLQSINSALRAAQKGDRIIVANTGQPYRECITLQGAGNSGRRSEAPFVIEGNGAVLDGAYPVPVNLWEHYRDDVFRFRPMRLAHQILFLNEKPAMRQQAAPEAQQLPELAPLQWSLFRRHVYFRVEKDALPHQYNLSHTVLPAGITLYQVRHVVIRDLVIQGYQLDGVNAQDGVTDATLVGLTCRGNARSGISVGGASRVRVEACLVGNNGVAQVRAGGWSKTDIVNCDLVESTAPPVLREGDHAQVQVADSSD